MESRISDEISVTSRARSLSCCSATLQASPHTSCTRAPALMSAGLFGSTTVAIHYYCRNGSGPSKLQYSEAAGIGRLCRARCISHGHKQGAGAIIDR